MKRLWCLALCVLLLTGCMSSRGESRALFAMDTEMELTAYGRRAGQALDAAEREIKELDALLAARREGSDIDKANRARGTTVTLSERSAELLRQALDICIDTQGALDVTVYPLMRAWGFDSKRYVVPGEHDIDMLLTDVDYAAVRLTGNELLMPVDTQLDLGAVGKGYAGDRVIALWKEMGVKSGLLNLGGNVHCLGRKPDGSDWNIGIRDPEDENGVLCTVKLRDAAVVTSGAYQRYFEKDGQTYHHIMDPRTGYPAQSGASSVTVIGKSGTVCDGLSTALFVMGSQRAAEYWRTRHDFDVIYYTQDGKLWFTSGLAGQVTLRDGLEGQMLLWDTELWDTTGL